MPDLGTLVAEAQIILCALHLPKEQTNERAALVLLAMLDLRPGVPWVKADNPTRGIRPIMDYVSQHLGTTWAENTRETVRRFTVHQMVQAGLLLRNPDDPARPTNSPYTVYQVAPPVLALVRAFARPWWQHELNAYLAQATKLAEDYAAARDMHRIPLTLPNGVALSLTPGGQNPLVRAIVEEFCPRFTPGAYPVYVGDTGAKMAWFDEQYLAGLGVTVESHGQIPDVVVHDATRDWLVLIEAVTSHGPMNAKRLRELRNIFAGSRAGLVFVTAFLDRKGFTKYLQDIAWETEVWVASDATHMIHFNGERFLGPYEMTPARTGH